MADDTLNPDIKKKLDEALKKAGITDDAIIQKAEKAADKSIPQIQDYAKAVDDLDNFHNSPASKLPTGIQEASTRSTAMIQKMQELGGAEDKALRDQGVADVQIRLKIEQVTEDVTKAQAHTIVTKGAKAQSR